MASQHLTQLPMPPSPASRLPAQHSSHQTVHRTDNLLSPAFCTQPDLALQVCPNVLIVGSPEPKRRGSEPRIIFSELGSPKPRDEGTAISADTADSTKGPKATPTAPSQPPSRTARIRLNKNLSGQTGLINIDTRDFYNIPLQYTEGRDLLSAVGAASIPIPPNLVPTAVSLQRAADPKPMRAKQTQPPILKPKNHWVAPKRRPPSTHPTRQALCHRTRPCQLGHLNQLGPLNPSAPQKPNRVPPPNPQPPLLDPLPLHVQNQPEDADALPSANPLYVDLEVENEDSYLDRVDYSDGEDLVG